MAILYMTWLSCVGSGIPTQGYGVISMALTQGKHAAQRLREPGHKKVVGILSATIAILIGTLLKRV